jgi:hypothetical protein
MAELRLENVSKTYPSGLFDPATGTAWARMRPGAAEPEFPSSAPAGQGSDRAG